MGPSRSSAVLRLLLFLALAAALSTAALLVAARPALASGPQCTITSPTQSQVFSDTDTITVAWTTSYAVSSGYFTVIGGRDGEQEYWLGTVYAEAGRTSYEWNWTYSDVPGDYHVRVRYGWDSSTQSSNAYFSIESPGVSALEVTNPGEDGEITAAGSEQEFSWETDHYPLGGSFEVVAVGADEVEHVLGEVEASESERYYGATLETDLAQGSYDIRVVYTPEGEGDPVQGASAGLLTVGFATSYSAEATVGWALDHDPDGGSFSVYATGWDQVPRLIGATEAVENEREYELAWSVGVPAGDYLLSVVYSPEEGDDEELSAGAAVVGLMRGGFSSPTELTTWEWESEQELTWSLAAPVPEGCICDVWVITLDEEGEELGWSSVTGEEPLETEEDQTEFSLPWTVDLPAGASAEAHYYIYGDDGDYAEGVTEFSLSGPTISVTAPAADARWLLGDERTIAWSLSCEPTEEDWFNVYVSDASGQRTLAEELPAEDEETDYEYTWTVDGELSSDSWVTVEFYDASRESTVASGESGHFAVTRLLNSSFIDVATVDAQTLHLHAGPLLEGPIGGSAWEQLCASPVSYSWSAHADEGASGGSYSSADEIWSGAYGGPALDTALRSQLVLRCYGSSLTWVYAKGADLGIARIYVDGELWGTVDQYAAVAEPQATTTISGLDVDAYHEVRIIPAGGKNASSAGYEITHDAFVARRVADDAAPRTLDDAKDASTFYAWATARAEDAHGGAYAFTDSQSAATAFTFVGDEATWVYREGPDLGKARVYVDGEYECTVDQYASTARCHPPSANQVNLVPNPRAHLGVNGWDGASTPSRVTEVPEAALPTGADAAFASTWDAGVLELATEPFTIPEEAWEDHSRIGWQLAVHVAGTSNADGFLLVKLSWYNSYGGVLYPVSETVVVNPGWQEQGYDTRLPKSGFVCLSGRVAPHGDKCVISVALLPKGDAELEDASLYLTNAGLGWADDGDEVPAYADGDSPGWIWDGDAHASTSRTVPVSDTAVEIVDDWGVRQHTVVIVSDGTKNDNSTGYRITSDAFVTRRYDGAPYAYTEAESELPAPGCVVSVTGPSESQTLQGGIGAVTSVAWRADDTSGGGQFSVFAVDEAETAHELGSVDAVPGQHEYELPWTVTQPAGDYRIRVVYRPGGGGDAVTATGGEFTLSGAGLAVTWPNGGETLPAPGGSTNVTWSMSSAPSSGSFRLYALSSDDECDLVAEAAVVPTQTDYSASWSVHQAPGAYRLAVAYVDAGGVQRVLDASDAAFTIPAPGLGDGPTVSLTAPGQDAAYRLGETVEATVNLGDLTDPEDLASVRLGVNRTGGDPERYRGLLAWFREDPNPTDARPGWDAEPIAGGGYFAVWDSAGGAVDYGSACIAPDWSTSSISFGEDEAELNLSFRLTDAFGDVQECSLDTMVAMAAGSASWHYPWQENAVDLMVQPGPLAAAPSAETAASGWFTETDADADGEPDAANDAPAQGRGSVTLSWEVAPAADGYDVYLFDGNSFRSVGTTTGTSWSSSGAGIYPTGTQIAAWDGYAGDPFQGGSGLDLRDDPNDLYRATAGTSFDSRRDYSFCVVPYNDESGAPALAEADPRAAVTLDNRTVRVCDAPRHTTYELGSFAGSAAQAILDQGSLALAAADLQIASWGPAAALDRYYSSSVTSAGLFAPGWRFGFERSLDLMSSDLIAYKDARGERYLFHLVGSTWLAPNGMAAGLAPDGDEWQLAFKGGSALTFDEDGVLLAETDRNGNAVTYERDGDELTISAANGQAIVVTFAQGGAIDHAEYTVASQTRRVDYDLAPAPLVTYFAGQSGVEHAVGYAYASGRLTAVTAEDWPQQGQSASEEFDYDQGGALEEVRLADYDAQAPDRADARAELAYDGRSATVTRFGRVGSVGDGAPHTQVVEAFTWNATGTTAAHTAPRVAGEAAATTTYAYTKANLPARETSPTGWTTSCSYDERGNLIAEVDGEGQLTSYLYDEDDSRIQQTDVVGAVTDYIYDEAGNLTEVQSELTEDERSCTQHAYDSQGRLALSRELISGTPEAGVWHETDYDEDGYALCGEPLTTIERAVQLSYGGEPVDLEATRTYDGFGNLVSETEQHEAGAQNPVVAQASVYDLAGRLTTSTDAAGVVTHHSYDTLGNETESWRSAPGTEMKADWHATSYDAAGRTLTETAYLSDPEATPSSAVSSVVTHAYDGLGREISSDDSTVGGEDSRTLCDARGSATASWAEGVASYASEKASRSVYDAEGKLLESYNAGADDPTGYTYWPSGAAKRTTSPDGSWTECSYDAAGNALTQSMPAAGGGQATQTSTYDLGGRLVTLTEEASGTVTSYKYDLTGRTTAVHASTDPDEEGALTTYNLLGWTLREVEAEGSTTSSVYDAAGRVTASVVDGQPTETSYRADGQPAAQTASGAETTYTYDAFARLVRAEDASGGGYQLVLDSLGRTLNRTDLSSGVESVSTYPENAPRSPEEPAETLTAGTEGATTTVYRDASGQEARRLTEHEEEPIAERTVTARDAAGRETASTLELGGGPVLEEYHAYDASDNPVRVWGDGFDESADETDAYAYEPGTGLLTSMDLRLEGGALTGEYDYDAVGRLVEAREGESTTSYSYDARGRVVSSTVTGPAALALAARSGSEALPMFGVPALTTTYTYAGKGTTPTSTVTGGQTTDYARNGKGQVTGRTTTGGAPKGIDPGREDFYTSGDPHTITYEYYEESSSEGALAGMLSLCTDYWYSRQYNVTYAAGMPALIGGWDCDGLWLNNFGWNACYWSGDQLVRYDADDLVGDGITGSWTYTYDAAGHPCAASLDTRAAAEPAGVIDVKLVTDASGSVVELLDQGGTWLAKYSYDTLGNVTGITTQETSLISADHAARVARSQALRFHGNYYCAAMTLYWDGGWYDSSAGTYLSPPDGESSADPSGLSGNRYRLPAPSTDITDAFGTVLRLCAGHASTTASAIDVATIPGLMPVTGKLAKYAWWIDKVRDKGEWDWKRMYYPPNSHLWRFDPVGANISSEDFGNIFFGYVGHSMGFSPLELGGGSITAASVSADVEVVKNKTISNLWAAVVSEYHDQPKLRLGYDLYSRWGRTLGPWYHLYYQPNYYIRGNYPD